LDLQGRGEIEAFLESLELQAKTDLLGSQGRKVNQDILELRENQDDQHRLARQDSREIKDPQVRRGLLDSLVRRVTEALMDFRDSPDHQESLEMLVNMAEMVFPATQALMA